MSQALIVLGMHRSGTSLLARYLAESGVYMGSEMLPKHESNPAGHYEDLEILSLHNAILEAHGLNYKVMDEVSWHIRSEWAERAQELVRAREAYPLWGWKDPRTCLFIDFWKPLVPEAIYLVCYRHYPQVVRSLISREILFYIEATSRLRRLIRPKYTAAMVDEIANTYLKVWIHYNREILRHLTGGELRYVFTSFSDISQGNFSGLESLRAFDVPFIPPKKFKHRKSKSRYRMPHGISFDPVLTREADDIHRQFSDMLQISSID